MIAFDQRSKIKMFTVPRETFLECPVTFVTATSADRSQGTRPNTVLEVRRRQSSRENLVCVERVAKLSLDLRRDMPVMRPYLGGSDYDRDVLISCLFPHG